MQDAARELSEEEELKFSRKNESGSGRTTLVLALLVFVVGAAYFIFTRNSSVQNAFSSIKESTQDAATTSRVRTALLLSKHVSPFDIKVQTIQGEVTLEGQVPSEQVKTVADAIAQDTSSVKLVHNNLGVNPAIERNLDREHLGERVADLEIQTLVSDALSKNTDLAEKHVATQVKSRTVALTGMVQTTNQKYTAEQIAWQVPGRNHLAAKVIANPRIESLKKGELIRSVQPRLAVPVEHRSGHATPARIYNGRRANGPPHVDEGTRHPGFGCEGSGYGPSKRRGGSQEQRQISLGGAL